MSSNPLKRRQKIRLPRQIYTSQPSRPGLLDDAVGHPRRIIRLYRNSKLALLPPRPKETGDITQSLPHPRNSPLHDARPKHLSQHREVTDLPSPVAATAKEDPGLGYAMINIDASLPPLTTLSLKSSLLHVTASKTSDAVSFSPLPPLPSLVSLTSVIAPSESSGNAITATNASNHDYSSQGTGPDGSDSKLGVPLIVLVSVGGACVAIGIFLLFKLWTRPRRRERIKPSLPIIEKVDAFDDYNDGKESPVFGGKERSASRLGSEGPLWTWVQYSKPEIKEPGPPTSSRLTNDPRPSATDKEQHAKAVPIPSPLLPAALSPIPPINAQKRVSSASLYRHRESKDVGAAIIGDGDQILARSRSKLARRSQSHSVLNDRKRRDSGYRPDSAYEGADVSSPTTYFQPVTTPATGATPTLGTEGRARILSSYYAVAPYPRLSSLPMVYSIGTERKVHLSQPHAPERGDKGDLYQRSDSQAVENDHGAVPSSPEATLYPDDSMSVIAVAKNKRLSRSERKRMSMYLGAEPTSSGLLEMDFGVSRMSLSDLAEDSFNPDGDMPSFRSPVHIEDQAKSSSLLTGKPYDRPPRVPSPPPLPSLAQMALAHSNPEAYATYRSPTYSIYGLYGGNDRKSNITNPA